MYKTFNFLSVLLLPVLFFTSCEKETLLEVSSSEITATVDGLTQTISVSANKEWSASSSASWCTIVVSATENVSIVKITVLPNDTFDERSATVTISSAELKKTVLVKQKEKSGLIPSKNNFDITSNAQEIEVEVSANIQYDVTILGSWITQNTTKALTSNKLYFRVEKNETYDSREGKITITQKNGGLKSEVIVKQSQLDAVLIAVKNYSIPNSGQILDIELQTNIDYKIEIPETAKSWISHIETKGLRNGNVKLDFDANNIPQKRSSYVYFINSTTSKKIDSVKVEQQPQADGIYWVRKMGNLNTAIIQSQKDTISVIKLKGEINAADFSILKSRFPNLTHLNLNEVKCYNNEIPAQAFRLNKKLKSVILPISVTKIGDSAFGECANLEGNLTIPENVVEIGSFAFDRCNKLTGALVLPENITTIGSAAFRGCNGFTGKLVIPTKIKSILGETFAYCSGITGELVIPNNIENIGGSAFSNWTGITKLVLNEGLVYIDNLAFWNCIHLTGSVNIPNTTKYIGVEAFSHAKITELNLGNSIEEIDRYAFYDCQELTGEVKFPESLTKIGNNAFYLCRKLNTVVLPNKLKLISGELFSNSGLKSIIIPFGVETMGYSSFKSCSELSGTISIPESVTLIQEYAFSNCRKISRLALNEGVKNIERFAFADCLGITGEVIIPKSIISIRNDAFDGCNNIEYFKVLWEDPIVYYPNMLTTNKVIKVPMNSVDKYKNADGWKNHPIAGY